MGIIDSFIQEQNVQEHWIIEPHLDVYTKMFDDGWHLKPNVRILYGDWQWYFKYLPKFDGIFLDTWEEAAYWFLENAHEKLTPNGIFSFFNNPHNDFDGLHMIKSNYDICKSWGDIEFEEVIIDKIDLESNHYWESSWKKYYCPIIKKKKTEEMTNSKEWVKNPSHYGGVENPYEVIKVCESWELDKDAYLFNVVKYVARAGKKDPTKEMEDLKKAAFYLDRKIKNLEKKG